MNIIDKFHNWRRKIRWNKQYKSGRWNNLKNEVEALRYNRIIEKIEKFGTSNPSIIDLGAGEGILNERMNLEKYSSFKGVDFSKVSIEKAQAKKLNNATYEVGDLHNYTPEENYDIIVFNEAFYYIHNTEKANALKRISNKLNKDGIIIVSIFREGIGSWQHFKENPTLKELDFDIVTTDEENRYWKIGVYKPV